MKVTWGAPEEPNGIIIGYFLSFAISGQSAVLINVNTSENENEHSVPNLCRTYTVTIAAYTNPGTGQVSYKEFDATAPGLELIFKLFIDLSIIPDKFLSALRSENV